MRIEPLQVWFVVSAGWIFTLTGLAKIVSVFSSAKLLDTPDPVFGLETRYSLIAIGVLEFAVAAICFLRKKETKTLMLITWLATGFFIYRASLWLVDWERPCTCLGNLLGTLNVSPEQGELFLKLLVGYLLTGGYGLLMLAARRKGFSFPNSWAVPRG